MSHVNVAPRDRTPIKLEMSEWVGEQMLAAIRRVMVEHPDSETALILGWLGKALADYGVNLGELPAIEPGYMFRKNI